MRFQVIERARKWRDVDNHLDCRHCPICGATVHGNRGQHAHLQWHIELGAQLDAILNAAAADLPGADDGQPAPWTAAVDGDAGEQEEAG